MNDGEAFDDGQKAVLKMIFITMFLFGVVLCSAICVAHKAEQESRCAKTNAQRFI